ncbi:hypothetical protein [Pedobacter sp. MC2016-24]|uniref:hypothetical protein n=1 Tax=Pedobacter sp. MC2016-24 TaxID=2780090 RepID=UPI001882ADA5|nr:hypothetical protein [Pedobacter sp. MC2016-24]MBE9599515.1 hypothetical protein [Pedobacter sp. MC2016-24]
MTDTSRRRRRTKKRSVGGYAQKYRSLILGAFLILVGLGSVMYSFDYKPEVGAFFDLSKWRDLLTMWPFLVVLIGFAFILFDYFKNSSKQKYK